MTNALDEILSEIKTTLAEADDRIMLRRKSKRTLVDPRIECRDRQDVDRVLFMSVYMIKG